MASLTESADWVDGIYQLEQSDPVLGGPGGIANRQAEQLASRTLYLKGQIEQAGTDFAAHLEADDPHPQYATEIFVAAQIAALINSAPGALDTLAELAAALGNDADFAATLTSSLAGKVAVSDKASTVQAQAGTDDLTWMTPLKTAQAIAALVVTVAAASETVAGKVELATNAETVTGTDTTRATHPAGVKAAIQSAVAALPSVSAATETATGTVELATSAETVTGTDSVRATHPAGVKAAIQSAITALVNSSPATLDTLNELAAALGNDANFATTMTNALAGKVSSVGGNVGQCTVDGTNEVGYRNIPQNSQSAAYTCVLTDKGKHILHPSADTTARTFTIPANASVAYPIGTAITFVNQASAGVLTIAITTDTMRLAGAGTTGSRTLAANGMATALKVTATEWIISGTGLS